MKRQALLENAGQQILGSWLPTSISTILVPQSRLGHRHNSRRLNYLLADNAVLWGWSPGMGASKHAVEPMLNSYKRCASGLIRSARPPTGSSNGSERPEDGAFAGVLRSRMLSVQGLQYIDQFRGVMTVVDQRGSGGYHLI